MEQGSVDSLEESRIFEWIFHVRLFWVLQRSTTSSSVARFSRQLLASKYSRHLQFWFWQKTKTFDMAILTVQIEPESVFIKSIIRRKRWKRNLSATNDNTFRRMVDNLPDLFSLQVQANQGACLRSGKTFARGSTVKQIAFFILSILGPPVR